MDIYEQLRRDEGVRQFPYTDTVGKLTIGVGRNISDVGLRSSEIEFLLKNDVAEIFQQLKDALPWWGVGAADELALNPRDSILVNMGMMGVSKLLQFHQTLSYMEAEDWNNAATAMLNSKWAQQVGDRAKRLAEQMRTGEWQ